MTLIANIYCVFNSARLHLKHFPCIILLFILKILGSKVPLISVFPGEEVKP
jgi:hypothetical protein